MKSMFLTVLMVGAFLAVEVIAEKPPAAATRPATAPTASLPAAFKPVPVPDDKALLDAASADARTTAEKINALNWAGAVLNAILAYNEQVADMEFSRRGNVNPAQSRGRSDFKNEKGERVFSSEASKQERLANEVRAAQEYLAQLAQLDQIRPAKFGPEVKLQDGQYKIPDSAKWTGPAIRESVPARRE